MRADSIPFSLSIAKCCEILLCDVQKEVYPELETIFVNLINKSGYPNIKFEKKVDFEKLYSDKLN